MDGENNGKPYFLMDDLGVPLFLETPIYDSVGFTISIPNTRRTIPPHVRGRFETRGSRI